VIARRIAAVVVSVALVALVVCDISINRFTAWWNAHSLTGDIVSSLLLLAVTGFVVDEVVARRRRRDREVSVAAQALIVYGQARRTCDALVGPRPNGRDLKAAKEESRDLASMVLTASSSLFDDPAGREFLGRVQRLMAALYVVSYTAPAGFEPGKLEQVKTEMTELTASVTPLMARVPPELLPTLDELPGVDGAPICDSPRGPIGSREGSDPE
jgi:hypothetical protein